MSSSDQAKPPVVLTIAGFDPSSGAGVTADLQVIAAHKLFGTSAITALTVQSTQGVATVHPLAGKLLRETLLHLLQDMPPVGVKIGMLATAEIVHEVASFLRQLSDVSVGSVIPVVLDPVLRSSSGKELLARDARLVLGDELLPLVSWITPNLAELGELAGEMSDDVLSQLIAVGRKHPHLHIVATGGDQGSVPVDLWRSPEGLLQEFRGERINTTSTHGTGCAFSSALLCGLVKGLAQVEAVAAAKRYVEGALRSAPGLGRGKGPLSFFWGEQRC